MDLGEEFKKETGLRVMIEDGNGTDFIQKIMWNG